MTNARFLLIKDSAAPTLNNNRRHVAPPNEIYDVRASKQVSMTRRFYRIVSAFHTQLCVEYMWRRGNCCGREMGKVRRTFRSENILTGF